MGAPVHRGGGDWGNTQDISFTVTGNRVGFTYPTADQQNINTITPFSWNPATGAQAYQLTIGTKPGVADLVNSGILAPNVTNYRVPALPTGKTLYAKIVAKINGSWTDYQAISFTAAPNPVAFTHPTQGQTGVSTPTTFTWSTTPGRDRLSDVDRHPARRREPAQIRVAETQHLVLPGPGAPRRPDALCPDLHRRRQRLGQLPGHHLHHRRLGVRDREPRDHQTADRDRRPPADPAWMRRLLRLEPNAR